MRSLSREIQTLACTGDEPGVASDNRNFKKLYNSMVHALRVRVSSLYTQFTHNLNANSFLTMLTIVPIADPPGGDLHSNAL